MSRNMKTHIEKIQREIGEPFIEFHWVKLGIMFRCCLIRGHEGGSESTIFINLIPPIVVAWLLQYSGSRVEHKDEFSSHKRLTVRFKMVNLFWILRFGKNNGLNCLETENKTS